MFAGRFGAIASARRNSINAQGKKRSAAAARARQERKRAEQIVSGIMEKYDKDKSGSLDEAQVVLLLTDLDYSTPPGTKPTEEEIAFVMQVADKSRNKRIDREELVGAITIWNSYLQDKASIDEVLDKYDTDKSGSLSHNQTKALLTELNEGTTVTDEEVKKVFEYADVCATGDLKRVEVLLAINYWYHVADEKAEKEERAASKKKETDSGCCVIL